MVDIGNESQKNIKKKSQYILLWSLVYTVTLVEFQYFSVFEHCENGLYSKDCFKQKCTTKEIIA